MLAAIRLDHQAEPKAAEVDDVGAQRHLPTKAIAIHDAMPEVLPKLALCIRPSYWT